VRGCKGQAPGAAVKPCSACSRIKRSLKVPGCAPPWARTLFRDGVDHATCGAFLPVRTLENERPARTSPSACSMHWHRGPNRTPALAWPFGSGFCCRDAALAVIEPRWYPSGLDAADPAAECDRILVEKVRPICQPPCR